MSHNPYAPNDNWNTGNERRQGGVPLWALLVACLSTLALGCVGGLVGGFAFGFAAGDASSEALEEYFSSDAFGEHLGGYGQGEVSVVARALPTEEGAETMTLEVLVNNLGEEPQHIDTIDIYHELAKPSEVVRVEPPFNGTELFTDEDDSDAAYTAYAFDPIVVMPGKTATVRFNLDLPPTRRTGDVDVWTESGFVRAHVHLNDAEAPASREPGY